MLPGRINRAMASTVPRPSRANRATSRRDRNPVVAQEVSTDAADESSLETSSLGRT